MSLTAEIVSRRPLESAGNSGNVIEHVTLRDGRELVLKRVSPEWDWMSRVTHDRGRLGFMWDNGLFERVPAVIDHATVSVETEGNAWSVFMRDVSGSLVAPDTPCSLPAPCSGSVSWATITARSSRGAGRPFPISFQETWPTPS